MLKPILLSVVYVAVQAAAYNKYRVSENISLSILTLFFIITNFLLLLFLLLPLRSVICDLVRALNGTDRPSMTSCTLSKVLLLL